MDAEHFDLFDYVRENTPAPSLPSSGKVRRAGLSHSELRQAAFAFLTSLHPTAAAENVSTRCCKYQAAAGFWRTAGSRSRLSIERTVLVVMYENLDHCFLDCAGREARLVSLSALQKQRELLEAQIRREEPELASKDDLFSEFRTWNYSESRNQEYHRLRTRLNKELLALTRGSRLEKLRQAGVADLCYLAVPQGLVDPNWLLPEWGIVELFPASPRFRLLREASPQDNVTPTGRMNLAINIGVAASAAARFAAGVDANGRLRKPPRRRGRL